MNVSTSPIDVLRRSEGADDGSPDPVEDGKSSGHRGAVDLLDPERLWQRARQLRYWLFALLAAAVSLAILYTLLQTPQYRATAQIEISRVDRGGTDIEEITLEGEARDRQYYETQFILLKSRAHAERVTEAENLPQNRAALTALGFPEDANPSVGQVASVLLRKVSITPLERSNLVDISVSSASPTVSASLANAWARQFLEANYEKRFGDTRDARAQIEQQLAEMRQRLEASEAELNTYANANGIVVLQNVGSDEGGGQSTLVEGQLASLNQALSEATARRITAQSAVQSGVNSNEGQSGIRSEIARVEATLARLRTTLGPENSQVQAQRAELQSLRSALSQASGLSGSDQRAQLRAAQREEAELQRQFEQARQRYLAQRDQGVQYGILEREVSTNRELYNSLLQRYKELGVSATGRNNMTLVQQAEPPSGPYSPSLAKNVLIALVGALVIAGALVVLLDMLDNGVRDPSEVRRRLGLPVLGLVPQLGSAEVEEQLRNPHSMLSEAYASARVAIDFARDPGDKVVLITSSRPDEGKSLSALALAYNSARQNKKVLLIDMDLRRKGLSIRLNESKNPQGLATYLAGETESLPIIHNEQFGLDFVRSGRSSINAADILSTSRMEIALTELRHVYDLIILDAPPVLGLADTPQVASAADGIVYVVQANVSTFRSVGQALSRLRASRDKILGVVVTKLDKRNESYAYGYGYGYGYSYGGEATSSPGK